MKTKKLGILRYIPHGTENTCLYKDLRMNGQSIAFLISKSSSNLNVHHLMIIKRMNSYVMEYHLAIMRQVTFEAIMLNKSI